MSKIVKMTIQGVRSFGPDDSHRGQIEFYSPLTLILGPNGTGKTTIIECLKYMTTGDLPPGHINGSFVHDPKIANEQKVKGQVRLIFKDVKGTQCLASRTMEVTQQLKKVQFKTLDGVLRKYLPSGVHVDITSRHADLNREIPALLGVSKAILENVIFCHQEDSNWPLSEGKTLKTKFDDIFATSRFGDALDEIRKLRKKKSDEIKLYEKDVDHQRVMKEQADTLKRDMNEKEAKLEAIKDSIKNIDKDLLPIKAKLQKIVEKEKGIWEIQTKYESLRIQKKESEQTQQDLRKNIKKLFTGSTRELEQQLRDFKKIVEEKEEKLAKLKEELNKTEEKLDKCSNDKSDILLQLGKLEQEQKQHQENVEQRDKAVKEVAAKYGFSGYRGDLSETDLQQFRKDIDSKCKEFLESGKKAKEKYDDIERDVQKQVDEARGAKTKMETELQMKRDSMKKNEAEIKKIAQDLNRVDASADRLNIVTNDLKTAEKDLDELEKSLDVEKLKAEVNAIQEGKMELDSKLKNLDYELSQLTKDSEVRTQLDMYKKDKNSKKDQIKKLRNKHEDSVQHLLETATMPAENLDRTIKEYLVKQTSVVDQLKSKLEGKQKSLYKLESNRDNVVEECQKKEKELSKYKEQFLDVCDGIDNFDDKINETERKIKQKRDELSLVQGTSVVFKKYIEKLKKDDAPCPLCKRNFDEASEIEELINDLESKMLLLPKQISTVDKVITENQEKYNRMQQLKPIRANVIDIDSKELPALKAKQKSIENEVKTLKSDIAELKESLEVKQNDETTARSLLPDLGSIDRFNMEIRDLDRKINAQSAKLTGSSSDRTLQEVNSERQDLQLIVENKNKEIEHKRRKIHDHNEYRHKLSADVNDLKSQKLAIESDVQQRQKLEENKERLLEQNDILFIEIQETETEIQPLEEKIKKLMSEKKSAVETRDTKCEQEKEKFTQAKNNQKEITALDDTIKNYVTLGRDKVLKKNEQKMQKIENDAKILEEEKQAVTTNISEIQEDLHSQKFKERELRDNMTLKEKEEQCKKLEVDIKELEVDLGGLEASSLDRDKRKYNEQYTKLDREKNQLQGNLRGYQDSVQDMRDQLESGIYKDAEKLFHENMITLKTTEMACSDLDKYYKALDRTIMSFHQKKMSEINKIIRELWRNTYKGNDIETIEIRSNEEEGSGAAQKRRSYNYRVVMLKGETPIDMRGRCSAGQKVLASLIIRLALAETFCLNCGILALDEPTTNLDRENIESLASALVDIIKSRSQQRNFQLVAITHDEDFVELLGRSDYVDYFFKVKKNKNGHSELSKTSIQDFAR